MHKHSNARTDHAPSGIGSGVVGDAKELLQIHAGCWLRRCRCLCCWCLGVTAAATQCWRAACWTGRAATGCDLKHLHLLPMKAVLGCRGSRATAAAAEDGEQQKKFLVCMLFVCCSGGADVAIIGVKVRRWYCLGSVSIQCVDRQQAVASKVCQLSVLVCNSPLMEGCKPGGGWQGKGEKCKNTRICLGALLPSKVASKCQS